jgi:hypothetical protein
MYRLFCIINDLLLAVLPQQSCTQAVHCLQPADEVATIDLLFPGATECTGRGVDSITLNMLSLGSPADYAQQ